MSANTADMCSGGCGEFWIANSITSLVLGERNRKLQEEANKRNEKFQLEMEHARCVTEDKRLQEEFAFKRRLLAISRQYCQEESTKSFNAKMQETQLDSYIKSYWPLTGAVANTLLQRADHTTLNVILMPSQFFPETRYRTPNTEKDKEIFKELEFLIKYADEPYIGGINYLKDAALNADIKGGNAAVMNIHFLMSQLPTLVIYPYYDNYKMNYNAAIWEAQAARPLMKSLFSVDYNPNDAEVSGDYMKKAKELFHVAIVAIVGSIRDSYSMLTQGKAPTMYQWLNDVKHKEIKKLILQTPEIRQFVKQEYDNIVASLDYVKNPKLLEMFSKEDIENIKNMSNQLKL